MAAAKKSSPKASTNLKPASPAKVVGKASAKASAKPVAKPSSKPVKPAAAAPKAASKPKAKKAGAPTHEQIAARAHAISQSGEGGSEIDNWCRAERELKGA